MRIIFITALVLIASSILAFSLYNKYYPKKINCGVDLGFAELGDRYALTRDGFNYILSDKGREFVLNRSFGSNIEPDGNKRYYSYFTNAEGAYYLHSNLIIILRHQGSNIYGQATENPIMPNAILYKKINNNNLEKSSLYCSIIPKRLFTFKQR